MFIGGLHKVPVQVHNKTVSKLSHFIRKVRASLNMLFVATFCVTTYFCAPQPQSRGIRVSTV